MDYTQAAETLLDKSVIANVLLFLIAGMVLLILVAKAADAVKKLFGHKQDNTLEAHCKDAEARFRAVEKHNAENHDHIADLKEGNRALCVAVMSLLNHAIHDGNTDEMTSAYAGIKKYLINRK